MFSEQIAKYKDSIKAKKMDLSYGELMNMYEDGDLIISDEFSNTFRWNSKLQTRFIESLLLGVPTQPIFVIETNDNRWELIYGIQELCTMLAFFGKLNNVTNNNLVLTEASILTELKGFTVDDLPLNYRLLLKMAVCSVNIMTCADIAIKYKLCSLLNTGGTPVTRQELRNCIFRKYDNRFSDFIQEEAKATGTDDESILRFLTLKNFGSNTQDAMDEYMLKVSKGELPFDYEKEHKSLAHRNN